MSISQSDSVRPSLSGRVTRYLRKRLWLVAIIALLSFGALGAGLKFLDEDARQQAGLKPKDRSLLSKVNPFLPAPNPTPTPQLSKEYIYAGSRLLAVEDANATAVIPADLAVWRPSTGVWWVIHDGRFTTQNWGVSGDIPVPGDFDGDGKTDFSIFRPSTATWYIIHSGDGSQTTTQFGLGTDKPAPADYDGDGKTDRAVFREDTPSSGLATWNIVHSSTGNTVTTQYGATGDTPAPGDYDGDGMADLGVWRQSDTNFYSVDSADAQTHTIDFTATGAPVSSDYDGDGKADYAIFDASASPNTNWYIRSSITGTMLSTVTWGNTNDKPVQNDYDADGKCDIAVWRPATKATWYIRQSSLIGQAGELRLETFGKTGDIAVPAYYRR